jgi:nitrite reductase/ring-hydroxylating ferredoxin subunit
MEDDVVPSYEEIAEGLTGAWFPVARSIEIDRPQGATLLGVPLVAFRAGDGQPCVLSRRCIHRGGDLALGQTVDGVIECPYHGWRYGSDGVCALVPSLGEDARVPPNARIKAYPARERFGLVWTCLGDPLLDVPALPELEPLGMTFLAGDPVDTEAGLLASMENFRDVAHFPFVHASSMGEVDRRVERLDVRSDGIETWLTRKYSAQAGAATIYRDREEMSFVYHTVVPSLSSALIDDGGLGKRVVMEGFCPVSVTGGCRIYLVSGCASDYTGASPEEALAAELGVLAEDKVMLDALMPREVPLQREMPEVSVLSDRYTMTTRRAFLDFIRHARAQQVATVSSGAAVAEPAPA